jgi:hypothetical protein
MFAAAIAWIFEDELFKVLLLPSRTFKVKIPASQREKTR